MSSVEAPAALERSSSPNAKPPGAPSRPPPPPHTLSQRTRERTEAEMSASGVIWSDNRSGWVPDEEADAEREEEAASEVTVAGDGQPPSGQGFKGGDEVAKKLTKSGLSEKELKEVVWLEWEEDDAENPFNWSNKRRWTTAWIVCAFTAAVAWTGSALPIGNASMIADLGCSHELAVMGLSAYPLGFAMGPLALAPFSEAYGRWWVYLISCALYCVFLVPIAVAKNIDTVIVFRLFAGIAGSTGSTLVGGSIADLFQSYERGLPMALFSVAAFGGTGLGPLVSGFLADRWGWRSIQWCQLVIGGILLVALALLTRETRGSVILSRRAARMRKESGSLKYQCRSDAERASLVILIKNSLSRPLYLLFTEFTVASFSLFIGFAWGVLYLCLEAVPLVLEEVYGFSAGEAGAAFASVIIAALIGAVTNIWQERMYARNVAQRGPEARLYASMVGGLLFPAGILIFAFSQGRAHWIGPCIGLCIAFLGIFTMYLAVFSYLADVYSIYASSALSGQSMCRNIAGTVFPLFTTQMYARLGFQWASFLAGMLGLCLSVVPFILYAYGPKIRARSRFAKTLAEMEAKKQ